MSENLKAFLGCPCTEIPAGTPTEKIMEVYQAAKARSVKEGFVPVLISDADWEEDAEIPAEHPWEIFAWMPFGGWNECPSDEEQMAAAKYWFEEYGAVPAVMTRDVLEFDLPAPIPKERAMELAMEQYTFCSDIVDQGCGSIGMLADSLWQSDKWFFWWD